MSLLAELRRRQVFKVGAAYLLLAWLAVQAASIGFPAFDAPPWALRVFILVALLGFPITLVMAWVFVATPDGVRLDPAVSGSKRVFAGAAVLVVLALVWYFHGQPAFRKSAPAAPTTVAAANAAATSPAPTAPADPHSIAVLPFVDMSQGKDQEYFSDGLSEQLLNELAQIPNLHVAGRTSSFYFKGRNEDLRAIGRKLNVATVLEGSVAKSGNTLRVTAQLINTTDGFHLWSRTYDREFKDVFALQDEIAANVVDALKLKLLPGQTPAASRQVDPEAYNQFLLGRKFGREQSIEGWAKAIAAYRKALQIDPEYAAAHAALADLLYETSYFNEAAATVIAKQEAALQVAETAVRLEPGLADAYRVRARIRSETRFDQAGAMTDIHHALGLSPNDSDVLAEASRLFTVSRRFEEAQAVADKAVELDPLSTEALLSQAELHTARRDWAGAREYYQRILQIAPDSNYASSGLVQDWLTAGNPQAALAAVRGPEGNARTLYSRALVEHSLGHRQQADRLLAELIAKYAAGWAYQIGVVYAWRGDKDKAFEWLERAWAQHDGGLLRIDTEPMLAPLWTDRRYPALRKKVGFPGP